MARAWKRGYVNKLKPETRLPAVYELQCEKQPVFGGWKLVSNTELCRHRAYWFQLPQDEQLTDNVCAHSGGCPA